MISNSRCLTYQRQSTAFVDKTDNYFKTNNWTSHQQWLSKRAKQQSMVSYDENLHRTLAKHTQ